MKKHFVIASLFVALLATGVQAAKPLPKPATLKTVADEGVKVKLTIGGKTYDVVTYNLNFLAADKPKTATEPIPVPSLYGYNASNAFNVTIKTSKLDQEFLDWITSSDGAAKDGQLQIIDADAGKTIKTITFSQLKPMSYGENFYNNGMGGANIQPTVNFVLHFAKVNIKL